MSSKITKDDVKRIADLCRLELTAEEVGRFAELFTETLKYMDMLNELDTTGVKETYQVAGLANVFQKSDQKTTLSKDAALSNAHEVIDGYFATKAVFER